MRGKKGTVQKVVKINGTKEATTRQELKVSCAEVCSVGQEAAMLSRVQLKDWENIIA